MKRWFTLLFLLLAFAAPCLAQDLSGIWQGAATNLPRRVVSPIAMQIYKQSAAPLSGCFYQEFEYGKYCVIYQLTGTLSAKTLVIAFDSILQERRPSNPNFSWDAAPITFSYDERQEMLVGKNSPGRYTRSMDYTFTFFRVKLKSSLVVPAAASTTLRVSGRDVRWFSNPALKRPVAQGNTFSTRLQKTTTFYLTQGFYPSRKSTATAVTIRVRPALKSVAKQRPSTSAPAIVVPVLLPTVLFFVGTATLLPTATPALEQLTADLKARPAMRIRIAGHTDRIGETDKNQVLSTQRAAAVMAFLVKSGIAPARLAAIGYGDSHQRYPTPDARNRRVEIEVLS
ncbi:OmpA family protein [Hymenobacter siberiensis]|uniref:OmpA family protein n=1 Tax=Hymenobacter siberiensis TaxID=2848396 RepID=UPI001C1E3ABB|nr:OmpA family protein [Hymenobacter siberiensis]MBU6121717.1 OmpA family protein [Hymenobacter siberiensis]